MRSIVQADLIIMIGVTALALLLMLTQTHLSRREGGILVATYVIYISWLFVR
jgi:Ca2+/Na+ antiporter